MGGGGGGSGWNGEPARMSADNRESGVVLLQRTFPSGPTDGKLIFVMNLTVGGASG